MTKFAKLKATSSKKEKWKVFVTCVCLFCSNGKIELNWIELSGGDLILFSLDYTYLKKSLYAVWQ